MLVVVPLFDIFLLQDGQIKLYLTGSTLALRPLERMHAQWVNVLTGQTVGI